MSLPFSITTPIYYVNDEPHLGHAYTTILADVLARYARLSSRETFFLTGTDEHGQKVQNAARKLGISPKEHADATCQRFQTAWKNLSISNDDFIRTTEPRHVRVVQHILADLWERGEIVRGEYTGWYCVPDERFWTEKDLVNGNCPDCGRPVEQVIEANYFFRMSQYQNWLIQTIQDTPDLIQPAHRRNEILGFLRQPLGDLCISRPASRLSWGIPLPFDENYVTYVWFDALINYITAEGYLVDEERFKRLWPQTIHLIGKDILTTHSVYWPIMLKAAGLPLPRTIFAHGWWSISGVKMGKSLGNAIKPLDLAQIFGVDAFRYLLMREMVPGLDAEFDVERFLARYQTDLANNFGNLLHRVTHMLVRYCGGRLPHPGPESSLERSLRKTCSALPGEVSGLVEQFSVSVALERVMDGLTAANQYLEKTAPWKQAADNLPAVETALYTTAETLRFCATLLQPVLPQQAAQALDRLGVSPEARSLEALTWGALPPGTPITTGAPLFPRVELPG